MRNKEEEEKEPCQDSSRLGDWKEKGASGQEWVGRLVFGKRRHDKFE